jgi:hypothetical protein
MPLILAVEPDPRQASRLAVVLRGRRNTDVVMVKSAETALAAMAGRVPDVVLTSQLLSPQEEQRLADWLKDLGPVAGHVQALTIPILATSEKKIEQPRGLLSGLRRRADNAGSQGCEPEAFAEHVASYLEQGQVERLETGDAAPEAVAPATEKEEGAWLLTQTPQAAPAIDPPVAEIDTAPIVHLNPAYELPPEVVAEPHVTAAGERQVLTMPPAVIPLPDLEVVFPPPEIITVRDGEWEHVRAAARQDGDTAMIPTTTFIAPPPGLAPLRPDVPASTPVVAASDAPPVMDEWGLFDPSKCGFAALLDKLDEITEEERRAQSVESSVRIVTHY